LLLRGLAKESEGHPRSQIIKNRCQHVPRQLIPLEVHNKITMPRVQSALFMSNSGTMVSIETLGVVDCVNSYSPSQVLDFLGTMYDASDECEDQCQYRGSISSGHGTV
jgi:hypothetical protein